MARMLSGAFSLGDVGMLVVESGGTAVYVSAQTDLYKLAP